MLDELDLRRRQMDTLSGDFYETAHIQTKELVAALLADAGLTIRLGKTYTTPARKSLRRVEVLRDGKVVRSLDVPNGPAAYVRAFAIAELAR